MVTSRRIREWHMSGSDRATNNYDSFQATTRLEWSSNRERIGAVRQLFLLRLSSSINAPSSVTPIPHQVNRNGVSVGLIFRFPLLQERTPRVTR